MEVGHRLRPGPERRLARLGAPTGRARCTHEGDLARADPRVARTLGHARHVAYAPLSGKPGLL
eukprot:11408809-Alexandrium_andersonii.AAC.1